LKDGIDRLLELVPCEEFTFIVKGESLKTTLSEAVLISPIPCERLKTDPMNREFCFGSDSIEKKQFSVFLNLIRNREESHFSRENEKRFLPICKLLGNDQLSLIILGSTSTSLGVSESSASGMITISRQNFESCASQFSSYSVDNLRHLSKQTLHSLLSSPSFAIENENSLL
jgi:hypothetical protein